MDQVHSRPVDGANTTDCNKRRGGLLGSMHSLLLQSRTAAAEAGLVDIGRNCRCSRPNTMADTLIGHSRQSAFGGEAVGEARRRLRSRRVVGGGRGKEYGQRIVD